MGGSGTGGRDPSTTALLRAFGRTPAFVRDRHLTVVAANGPARALSPVLRSGRNLVRAVFVEGVEPDDCELAARVPEVVVALLQDSLEEHEADDGFRAVVGEAAARSARFAALWAERSAHVPHLGVLVPPGPRGAGLVWEELRRVGDYELTVVVLRPAA